jgi:hypothetical protein
MNDTPDEPRPPGEDPGDHQDRGPHGPTPPTTPSAGGPPLEPPAQPPFESPTQQALNDLPPLDDDLAEPTGRRRFLSGGRLAAAGLAVVVLLGGGVALARGGDDGDGGSDGVATVDGGEGAQADDDDGGGGGGGGPVDESEMQDAMLEYAECMREHGIDMPDPEFDGEGGGMVIQREAPAAGGGTTGGPGDEDFEAAQEACGEIMEEVRSQMPQLSPEEIAEMQDKLVAMAECMRGKGYDMPDPQVNEDGGVQIEMRGGGPQSGPAGVGDPRNDEFRDDQEACNDEVGLENGPMGRRGGPGGGSDDEDSDEGSDDDGGSTT